MSVYRRTRDWVAADLKKMVGYRGAAHIVRGKPRVILTLLGYLVASYSAAAVLMWMLGHLHPVDTWILYPAILAASMGGSALHRERTKTQRDPGSS